jgi:hypothetical protein
MTPADLKKARKLLGLTAAGLGRRLELEGKDPGRTVRLWEGGRPIPGPARVAIGYMLAEGVRSSLQEAVQQAQAILTPADPSPPVLEPSSSRAEAVYRAMIPKTRRRG